MFCRNILLLWNILPFKQLFVCKASSASVHSFFLIVQQNISINLHAICISNIVQQIEVILLDPVQLIPSEPMIRLHRYYKFACQLHNCYLISTDIARPVVLCSHLVKLLLNSQHWIRLHYLRRHRLWFPQVLFECWSSQVRSKPPQPQVGA